MNHGSREQRAGTADGSISRRSILQTAGVTGFTGLAGCTNLGGGGNGGGGSNEIRLGLAFVKTDGAYKVFKDGLLSQRMAIEEINNDGGIEVDETTYTLNTIEVDSGCDPAAPGRPSRN